MMRCYAYKKQSMRQNSIFRLQDCDGYIKHRSVYILWPFSKLRKTSKYSFNSLHASGFHFRMLIFY